MKYDVEPFTIPPARFHWKLYEVTEFFGGGKGGLAKRTERDQCCNQDAAASPCDGFHSWEAAKEDGKRRVQELMAKE